MSTYLFACLVGAAFAATPAIAETQGCWAVWPANADVPKHLLNNPHVTGLACRVTWEHLEPTPKKFNWSYLDGVFAAAEGAGKMVSLNVIPGNKTPAWVYQQGAAQFPTSGIPVPWNFAYGARWHRLIRALGDRYAQRPSLAHVKLTGVNHDGGELALPRTQADVQAWIDLGYTHDVIVQTFAAHADAWAAAFPRQELVLPIQTSGLPKVDGRNPVFAIIAAAKAEWPDRFVLASHALSVTFVNPHVAEYAAEGGRTGYQHLAPVTGESTFRMNGGEPGNEQEIFDWAVWNGLSAGGKYQEVYPGDAKNPVMEGALRLLSEQDLD